MTISEDLARIEEWLRTHAPATHADLGAPADPAQIANLENAVGFRLRPDVTALLRWHNGGGGHDRGFPRSPGFPISDTDLMAQTRNRFTTLAAQVAHEDGMQGWWEQAWLPVASDYTGNELVVDHASGEVFHFDPSEGRMRLAAAWPDLATLVAEISTALLTGTPFLGFVPVIDDGYLEWDRP